MEQRIPGAVNGSLVLCGRGDERRLVAEQWVRARPGRCFAFFSNAANLDTLTPPSLRLRILTPSPIEMTTGTLIAYRIRLLGLPIDWLTRIEAWHPPTGFTDVQLRGPYARWVHRHRFTPWDGGTLVRDEVDYALPHAPWSNPIHALFVRPRLRQIFAYRRRAMVRLLR